MRLVDSHAHLQSQPFDHDRAETIERARAAGVERLLIPAWDAVSSKSAIHLADEFDAAGEWIDAAAGMHPHEVSLSKKGDWERIVALAAHPRVVAIGETGLDFDRMHSSAEEQLANLRRHLRLAAETGKPAILHCRSAAGQRDAQDLLIAEMRAIPGPALLHSFSGPVDYAEAALELGAAIAFGGLVFRTGEEASARSLASSRRIGSSSRPIRRISRRRASRVTRGRVSRAGATRRSGSASPSNGSRSVEAPQPIALAKASSGPTTRCSGIPRAEGSPPLIRNPSCVVRRHLETRPWTGASSDKTTNPENGLPASSRR